MRGKFSFALILTVFGIFSFSGFVLAAEVLPFPYTDVNSTNINNISSSCFYTTQTTPDCTRPTSGNYAVGCNIINSCISKAGNYPASYLAGTGKGGGLINSDLYGACDAMAPWNISSSSSQVCTCYKFHYWSSWSVCGSNGVQNSTCTLYDQSSGSKNKYCNSGCKNSTGGVSPLGSVRNQSCTPVVNTGNCNVTGISGTIFTGTNNTRGFTTPSNNYDQRYLCYNSTFYFCGNQSYLNLTDLPFNKALNVSNASFIGFWQCNTTTNPYWTNTSVVNPALNFYWANLNNTSVSVSQVENGDSLLRVFNSSSALGQFNVSILRYTATNLNILSTGEILNFGNSLKNWSIFSTAIDPEIANLSNDNKILFNTSYGSSNNVTVVSGNNNMPDVTMLYPNNTHYMFKVNTSIDFNQTATDVDDALIITWNFGDGSSYESLDYVSYLDNYSANIKHNYTSTGAYKVKVKAQESNRNQEDSDTRTIFILKEGINVVPVITSPVDGASTGTGSVTFNISQSFVANCTNSIGSTIGSMINPGFVTADKLLNCTYLHAPGINATASGTRIFVNWSMGDGTYKSGNWTQNYTSVVTFSKFYTTPGQHIASVRLSYYGA